MKIPRNGNFYPQKTIRPKPTPFLPLSEPLFSPSCAPTVKSNFLAIKANSWQSMTGLVIPAQGATQFTEEP